MTDLSPASAERWRRRKVGLLGGSFNPAHEGHRAVSLYAMEKLGLDAVWWLVSPQNPLKSAVDMAPMTERLESAVKTANDPRILPTTIESALGTRYTIDTLTGLKQAFPETYFVWLMGDENLVQVTQWKDWKAIFHTVPVAVFRRLEYNENAVEGEAAVHFRGCRIDLQNAGELSAMKPPAWVFLDNPLHPASATAIRKARARGDGSSPPGS
ncbi:MAG: nicotinate-nucleotide adenylyltransferase [Pseudomonadota bacterium]|nr:nicotinate-nucleotide adenylyltransferase [Pseudomonadota bacterium]